MDRIRRPLRTIVASLLILTMLFSCVSAAAATLLNGDVDMDGKVTSADARLVLRYTVGLERFSDNALRCADADRDNNVTSADARLVLRASVGLETLKPLEEKKQTVVCMSNPIQETQLTFPGGKAQTLGTFRENGMTITVEPGAMPAGTTISAAPVDMEQLRTYKLASTTERVLFPMRIVCAGYDGSLFGDGVRITVPLMEESYDENTDYQRFFFCYYDETAKAVRYLTPDEIDTVNHTMTVCVPHFSDWWGVKATQEKQIDQFLERYCSAQAINADKRKKAASELEPYLKAKAEALGLTVEAAKDLVQSAVNYIGASIDLDSVTGTPGMNDFAGDYATATTNFCTAAARAFAENDFDKYCSAIGGAANAALAKAWKELKYSERAGSVFKNEYAKLLVPGAVDTVVANAGPVGKVLGAITEGDGEGALKAVGEIMENVSPAASLVTRATAFVANGLNTAFTYWKSNQIEELYQIYKNGGKFLFGNEVLPRNRESFLLFLNDSSGFTMAKGVQRFYNMDKIGEVCKKYGWEFKDYASMPQRYRDIFEKRAEDGLMLYFETRYAQEAETAKLKEKEKECVESMLYDTLGALRNINYEKYFGETATSYDLMARLEKLYHLREELTAYVDEAKLSKNKQQNWGKLLNLFLHYITTENSYDEGLERFLWDLKKMGLLKSTVDLGMPSALEDFYGTWSVDYHSETEGWVDYVNGVIHDGTVTDIRYSITVKQNKEGKTVVIRTTDNLNFYNGATSKSVTLNKGVNYSVYGKTLIVHTPEIAEWLRLTLISPTEMSYRETDAADNVKTFILARQ